MQGSGGRPTVTQVRDDLKARCYYWMLPASAAERLQLKHLPDWPRSKSRVNPFRIAAEVGLQVSLAPLPDEVAGSLHTGYDGRTAMVGTTLPTGEQDTMCARLLGHHLIARRHDLPVVIDLHDLMLATTPRGKWASAFGAALLLPPGRPRHY